METQEEALGKEEWNPGKLWVEELTPDFPVARKNGINSMAAV